MTFAYWEIEGDAADLHEHDHLQEEVWNVVRGEITLIVDGDERRLRGGMAAVIPPNAPHSARVVGPCRAIVTDYPRRLHLPGVPDK
jgi:mannose-6-phosphate isomerase-like protein (cupin superfamily)